MEAFFWASDLILEVAWFITCASTLFVSMLLLGWRRILLYTKIHVWLFHLHIFTREPGSYKWQPTWFSVNINKCVLAGWAASAQLQPRLSSPKPMSPLVAQTWSSHDECCARVLCYGFLHFNPRSIPCRQHRTTHQSCSSFFFSHHTFHPVLGFSPSRVPPFTRVTNHAPHTFAVRILVRWHPFSSILFSHGCHSSYKMASHFIVMELWWMRMLFPLLSQLNPIPRIGF